MPPVDVEEDLLLNPRELLGFRDTDIVAGWEQGCRNEDKCCCTSEIQSQPNLSYVTYHFMVPNKYRSP